VIPPIIKHASFLLLLICPLHAELLVTFQTSLGNVTSALQYQKAPQAVANFITLAQGTRSRVDGFTGALTRTPYYTGEKFFRIVNDASFKIAQTGSGTGTNSGGPGYAFRDEFDPSLTHSPYVLSMANSGSNTNGSQIFLTGNTNIPSLNNVHTIFGLITDPASRSVIDAILAAGNNGSTITAVTFSRTDAVAVGFDEFAQNLPECRPTPGNLAVTAGTSTSYVLTTPLQPGTTLQAFRSTDLTAWSKLGEIYTGTGQPGFSSITLDAATLPRAFYQLTTVTYSDALAPGSLAGRTLTTGLSTSRTFTCVFDSTGAVGSFTDSQAVGGPVTFTLQSYSKSPYTATWVINLGTLGFRRIRGTLNAQNELHLLGTDFVDDWTGFSWNLLGSGGLTLTK
jgi:cyclophilin family peptidyl-prolyl cis-trans isomerase